MRHQTLFSVFGAILFVLVALPALPAEAHQHRASTQRHAAKAHPAKRRAPAKPAPLRVSDDMEVPRAHVGYRVLCDAIRSSNALLYPAAIPDDFRSGTGRDVLLTVWNPSVSTSDIRMIEVQDGISRTPGFSVEIRPSNGVYVPGQDPYNGVNTYYKVTAPEGWVGLGLKTRTKNSGDAVYVPYNPAYQTAEIVANGWQYLIGVIDEAQRRLDKLEVVSGAKDLPLTEMIDRSVLFALILDEHMDKDAFATLGERWVEEKVLVLFALNRERTYFYSVSSAGASGIAQFMKGSYMDTRAYCADAKLPEDYSAAMRDHVTSVMAQHCYVDHMLAKLRDTRMRIPRTPQLLGAYLAAAYNAGPQAAIPAYRRHLSFCRRERDRKEWCQKDHGLPGETITYVRKFADVYGYVCRRDGTAAAAPHKKPR